MPHQPSLGDNAFRFTSRTYYLSWSTLTSSPSLLFYIDLWFEVLASIYKVDSHWEGVNYHSPTSYTVRIDCSLVYCACRVWSTIPLPRANLHPYHLSSQSTIDGKVLFRMQEIPLSGILLFWETCIPWSIDSLPHLFLWGIVISLVNGYFDCLHLSLFDFPWYLSTSQRRKLILQSRGYL